MVWGREPVVCPLNRIAHTQAQEHTGPNVFLMDTRAHSFSERLQVWAAAESVAAMSIMVAHVLFGVPITSQSFIFIIVVAVFFTWSLLLPPTMRVLQVSPFIAPVLVVVMGAGYSGVIAWHIVVTLLVAGGLLSYMRYRTTQEDSVFGAFIGLVSLTIFAAPLLHVMGG